MKKLWLLCCFLGVSWSWGQVSNVSTFPYYQDFENFSLCLANCRFRCSLDEGWVNAYSDQTDWSVSQGATPTAETGPEQDFAPGTSWGKYLFVEASSGCAGSAEAHLSSPFFDFSSLSVPILSFAYHMKGLGQGSLHLDIDTAGTWVEDFVEPFSGNEANWQVARICLASLYGHENVRFRFRAVTGRHETSDIAIDAFHIVEAFQEDAYVSKIFNDDCGNDSLQLVAFEYGNLGLVSLSGLRASFSVDNHPFSTPEIIPGSLKPCEHKAYAFSALADLSGPGTHRLRVAIQAVPLDQQPENDTLEIWITNRPRISHFPYEESFEHGTGSWQPVGHNISWRLGNPTGNVLRGAAHGQKCWLTANNMGVYNRNEYSYLESPCFDLGAFAVDPVLVFDQIFQLEAGYDSSWLEYSLDGGKHWQKIKSQHFTFLENGYNRTIEQVWSGNSSSSGPKKWQTVAVQLQGLAGETVRFRFALQSDSNIEYEGLGIDRIRIVLPYDVAVTAIETPYDTCGGYWGSEEPVRVRVWNKGYHDLPQLQLSYFLSGSTGYTVPESIPGGLHSGDSTTFTFAARADLSALGSHFITVAAVLIQDNYLQDNFLRRNTGNYPWAQVSLGNDTLFCEGTKHRLIAHAPQGQSYVWGHGPTQQDVFIDRRGYYTVKVIDDKGCPGWDTVLVDVLPQPRVGIQSRESVRCHGDSTGMLKLNIFGSVPPYQLDWDDGGNSLLRMNLPAGFYPFLVTDQNGCRLRDSIQIRQSDSLRIQLDKVYAAGCPADSSGGIDVTVLGGQKPYQYQWSNGATTEDIFRLQEGSYTLDVRDAYGCIAGSPSYQVNQVDSLPQAHFGFRLSGGTVVFKDSSFNAIDYYWDFGDGNVVSSETNPSYTYNENGEYVVKLIASNGCGNDTFAVVILVDAVPLDDLLLNQQISLGPNPLEGDKLNIRFQEPAFLQPQFLLYDMTGRLLFTSDLGPAFHSRIEQVHVPSQLPNGFYLAVVQTQKGQVRKKLRFLR